MRLGFGSGAAAGFGMGLLRSGFGIAGVVVIGLFWFATVATVESGGVVQGARGGGRCRGGGRRLRAEGGVGCPGV